MERRLHLVALLASLALGVGCGNTKGTLQGGAGKLQVASTLDFGQVYLGATPQKNLALTNAGDAQLSLNAALGGSAEVTLVSPASFTLAEGATSAIVLSLQATALGPVAATLSLSGDAAAQVAVTATVIADLACGQSVPCNAQTFDPNQGSCISTVQPDGTACSSGNACVTNQACLGGVCLGKPISCANSDVCTTPYCDPVAGCQYQDNSSRCQGNNPCQIYYCDPIQGCLSTPASNGTPCAAVVQCIQADVCLDGECAGVPLPDGTPCVAQKDPCAKDAKCVSGVCDSPTADALQPGDILWTAIADEFSDGDGGEIFFDGGTGNMGWRAAAATDDLGDLYIDEWADAGAFLVSLDVCGQERWRTTQYGQSSTTLTNGRHVLGNGVVISVMQDQTIIGQSQTNGQLLWSFSLAQAGFDMVPGFTIEDIALSNDGIFYWGGEWSTPDGDGGTLLYGMLGAVLQNGQSKFAVGFPAVEVTAPPPYSRFGYPLLVDENENLYTAILYGDGTSAILSYDQTGAARWTLPISAGDVNSFSENQGVFLEPISMTEFNSDGAQLWASTASPFVIQAAGGHSPVVTSSGAACVTSVADGGTNEPWHGAIESYGANAEENWSFSLAENEVPVSSEVLDANDYLYFGTNMLRVFALDTSTGAFLWQTGLPSTGPMYNGVIALTPAGSLIASATRELFSIYAGAPLASSPWPRFRGTNANTSCPAAGSPSSSP